MKKNLPSHSAQSNIRAEAVRSERATLLVHLFQRLTAREMEAAELLWRGRSNKEIARTMGVTTDTAKAHVSGVLRKLGVDSRTEAAVLYSEYKQFDTRLRPNIE